MVFAQRRAAYQRQGLSYEQASRKALKDSINDLGFTMLAASAAGALSGGTQAVLDSNLTALRDAEAAIQANDYSITELFQTKRKLNYISKDYERFSPQGQKKWKALETKYADLLSKQKNTMAAMEQRKRIEEAIRKETQENGYEMPFDPQLYRLALEMATPYGWDGIDKDAFTNKYAARNQENIPSMSTVLESSGGVEAKIIEPFALDDTSRYDIIDNIDIHRSLGAKAKNYNVFDATSGEWFQFAENTRIQNAEVFAGKNSRKPLHSGVAEGLTEQYGGVPDNWQHCKGYGIIDYSGEERVAEVHWFQEASVGKIKFKIKRWTDEG